MYVTPLIFSYQFYIEGYLWRAVVLDHWNTILPKDIGLPKSNWDLLWFLGYSRLILTFLRLRQAYKNIFTDMAGKELIPFLLYLKCYNCLDSKELITSLLLVLYSVNCRNFNFKRFYGWAAVEQGSRVWFNKVNFREKIAQFSLIMSQEENMDSQWVRPWQHLQLSGLFYKLLNNIDGVQANN